MEELLQNLLEDRPIALSSVVTGILRRRSTEEQRPSDRTRNPARTHGRESRAENSNLPELWVLPRSCSKKTPGERCNWETITRSVPLITKPVHWSSSSGISPMDFLFLDLLHGIRRFTVHDHQAHLARSEDAKVRPLLAFGDVEAGSPSIADELKPGIAGMRNDRENRPKVKTQPAGLRSSAFGRDFILQEVLKDRSWVANK